MLLSCFGYRSSIWWLSYLTVLLKFLAWHNSWFHFLATPWCWKQFNSWAPCVLSHEVLLVGHRICSCVFPWSEKLKVAFGEDTVFYWVVVFLNSELPGRKVSPKTSCCSPAWQKVVGWRLLIVKTEDITWIREAKAKHPVDNIKNVIHQYFYLLHKHIFSLGNSSVWFWRIILV